MPDSAAAIATVLAGHPVKPLDAAAAALLDTRTPETFSTVSDVLADAADAHQLPFIDAVDRAQNLATACGLVRTIGQDVVQAIMAQTFKRCRVHERFAESPPPVRTLAADSTVEALMYSLRERGSAALSERGCLDRFANLSSDQIRDVIKRLIALRPHYPNITDELLFKLGDQL
jgi:hypothetical protein